MIMIIVPTMINPRDVRGPAEHDHYVPAIMITVIGIAIAESAMSTMDSARMIADSGDRDRRETKEGGEVRPEGRSSVQSRAALPAAVPEGRRDDRHGGARGGRIPRLLRPDDGRLPAEPAVDARRRARRRLHPPGRKIGRAREEIERVHSAGRPILAGTGSVREWEDVAAILKARG
jgi:hypothetical protein